MTYHTHNITLLMKTSFAPHTHHTAQNKDIHRKTRQFMLKKDARMETNNT